MTTAIMKGAAAALEPKAENTTQQKNGRFSLNWKGNLMVAGVILAVISAASSFFLSLPAAGASFLAVGSLLAYAAYYVVNFNEGESLHKTVDQLREKNKELLAAEKRMTDNTITLEKQYKDIQELNKKLNASLNTLKTRTGDLEKANHNLENNKNLLQEQVTALNKQNQTLNGRVQDLEKTVGQFKEQVAEFTAENAKFATHVQDLGLDIQDLNKINMEADKRVQGFDNLLDEDLLALKQVNIQTQLLHQTVFDAFANQQKQLRDKAQDLDQQVQELQTAVTQFEEQNTKLGDVDNNIGAKLTELNQIKNEITTAKEQLDQLEHQLTQATENLNAKLTLTQNATSQLSELQLELDNTAERLNSEEERIAKKIQQLEKEQQTNLTRVTAKTQIQIEKLKEFNGTVDLLKKEIEELKREKEALTSPQQ